MDNKFLSKQHALHTNGTLVTKEDQCAHSAKKNDYRECAETSKYSQEYSCTNCSKCAQTYSHVNQSYSTGSYGNCNQTKWRDEKGNCDKRYKDGYSQTWHCYNTYNAYYNNSYYYNNSCTNSGWRDELGNCEKNLCKESSGCTNWSNCSNVTSYSDSSICADETSCSQTWNYSDKWVYTDTITTSTSTTPYDSTNPNPTLSLTGKQWNQFNLGQNTIVFNLGNIGFQDADGIKKYRIYKQQKNDSNWDLVTETQSSSYILDISTWPIGQYYFAVTAYDGFTWSADWNGSAWVNDHKEELTSKEDRSVKEVTESNTNTTKQLTTIKTTTATEKPSVEVAPCYAISNIISTYKYTAPIWLQDPFAEETTLQLQAELVELDKLCNLPSGTYSNSPVVNNFTIIKLNDITEMQQELNKIYKQFDKTATFKTYNQNQQKISTKEAIAELQTLISKLEE